MSVGKFGQKISFSVEDGGDQRFTGFRYIKVTKDRRRISEIAAKYAHRELAQYIANINGVRWVDSVLEIGRQLRIPDGVRASEALHVYAGDTAPVITGGYANIDVVARTERTGLSVFTGYDPITMSIPIRFESETENRLGESEGQQIEEDIKKLERFAGRGAFEGAAVGAPAIIRVEVTASSKARVVPLIPSNYQWTQNNPDAPVYWISGIEWDSDPWRNDAGNRIRQLATVTMMQYVSPDPGAHSLAVREKTRRADKKGTLIARRVSGPTVGKDIIDTISRLP